jgi:hypothetical protein
MKSLLASLAVLMCLSCPLHAGAMLDAGIVVGGGSLDVGATEYTLHRPGFVEVGIGQNLTSRIALKTIMGSSIYMLAENARHNNRPGRARFYLIAWVGSNAAMAAWNLHLKAHK